MEFFCDSEEELFVSAYSGSDENLLSHPYSTISATESLPPYLKSNTTSTLISSSSHLQETYPHRQSRTINKVDIIAAGLKTINRNKTHTTKESSFCNFNKLRLVQEIDLVDKNESGAWVMKFCPDSKVIAIGGQSGIICLYEVLPTTIESNDLLQETPSRMFAEHSGMITDISWSYDGQMLTSSLDKSVKLWRKSQEASIFTIKHPCGVNAVSSNPAASNYFVTAGKDSLIRLFKLPENQTEGLYQAPREVTALCYSPSGSYLAAGMKKGEVLIYQSNPSNFKLRLKYRLKCRNKYGLKSRGRNVTGLEFKDEEFLLVSTNDSRIRLYRFMENKLVQKYKGNANTRYPIRASFSPRRSHVLCGSEHGNFYIWNTHKQSQERPNEKNGEFESFDVRMSRNAEFSIFAPLKIVEYAKEKYLDRENGGEVSHVILSAGSRASLRVFINLA